MIGPPQQSVGVPKLYDRCVSESAFFIPGYEYLSAIPHFPVAPSGFDRRAEGIRPTQTAFLGDP